MYRRIMTPLVLLLLIAAIPLLASAQSTTTPGNTLDQLTAGESLWQQSGITNYQITVTDSTVWVEQTITLTVRNGIVVDQSATCQRPVMQSGSCLTTPVMAENYTVPGLFATAQAFLNEPRRVTALQIDPTAGYPLAIDSDIPHVYDIASQTRVVDFQVLP